MRSHRWPIVIVVLVGLVLSTVMRHVAAQQRGTGHLAAATPLSRMNSYALALLLGGLRGPLVMFLWPSSEGQKTEKNLEDFDTKVEWIRLLQAEFDTVHIFQIWNKAYNISVLMANLANKYATILDALDYAYDVDAERPNNINILTAIAGIYGEKLGASHEKNYYKSRIREETQAREPLVRITFPGARRGEFLDAAGRAGASAGSLTLVPDEKTDAISVTLRKSLADAIRQQQNFQGTGITYEERPRPKIDPDAPGFRRTELDPMLDEQGRLLAEYTRPRPERAVGGNDGSELQYLKPYEPFPYGISAHALDFNYRMRSQMLLRNANQHHAQLSDLVIDSRPALALRNWSEDAWEQGRRAELEALGIGVKPERAPMEPEERLAMENPTAAVPLDTSVKNDAALRRAIFAYERSAAVAADSLREYDRHLEQFRTNFDTYQSHKESLEAQAELVLGDVAFLKVIQGQDDRAAHARSAVEHYDRAAHVYRTHLLARYLEDQQLQKFFPAGTTRNDIPQLPPEQIRRLYQTVLTDVAELGPAGAMHSDEWNEYTTYIHRAEARLQTLRSATPAPAE